MPVLMPDLLFRLTTEGESLFKEFAAVIQPTEFAPGNSPVPARCRLSTVASSWPKGGSPRRRTSTSLRFRITNWLRC